MFVRRVPVDARGGITVYTVLTWQSSHMSYNAADHSATAVLLRRKGDLHLHWGACWQKQLPLASSGTISTFCKWHPLNQSKAALRSDGTFSHFELARLQVQLAAFEALGGACAELCTTRFWRREKSWGRPQWNAWSASLPQLRALVLYPADWPTFTLGQWQLRPGLAKEASRIPRLLYRSTFHFPETMWAASWTTQAVYTLA